MTRRNTPRVSFIGFGEAGQAIAAGLREAGIERIAAWDILFPQAEGERLKAAGDKIDGDRRVMLQGGVSVAVVLAAAGYPGPVTTGVPISGLDKACQVPGVTIFHAGTAMRDNRIVTAGGRVLTVVATGGAYQEAIDRAYAAVALISFEGMQYRHDIGRKAL